MDAVAELRRSDDPPESGVRTRVPSPGVAAPAPTPQRVVQNDPAGERALLAEVGEEVFFEVWDAVRLLAPLQGGWLRVGAGDVAGAALTVAGWHEDPKQCARALRRRWPELVPGTRAMDKLAWLMVDVILLITR